MYLIKGSVLYFYNIVEIVIVINFGNSNTNN